jgi:predicted Zn-dependent protease
MVLQIVTVFSLFSTLTWSHSFKKRAPFLASEDYSKEDIKAEIKFGREMAAKILAKYPLVDNKRQQKYLNLLGTFVSSQAGRDELTFHFAFIESDEINAYACPGGYVFVTSALLKLIENEDQLIGVLAHEIAHINQRHVVKKLKIRGGNGILESSASFIGGSSQSYRAVIATLLNKGMDLLFSKGLRNKDEYHADKEALEIINSISGSPVEYLKLMQKVRKKMNPKQVLSKTHPPIKKRIKKLKRNSRKLGKNTPERKSNEDRFKKYIRL